MSARPGRPRAALVDLRSFRGTCRGVSRLGRFLVDVACKLFAHATIGVRLNRTTVPRLLRSSAGFMLSGVLCFGSAGELRGGGESVRRLIFALRPFLLYKRGTKGVQGWGVTWLTVVGGLDSFAYAQDQNQANAALLSLIFRAGTSASSTVQTGLVHEVKVTGVIRSLRFSGGPTVFRGGP